ncbi:restriction endonuclease [Paenarthrobacter sp. NPDC058040]|uniref:restriction endonuclease n=1 Tax=unclassified Paenarthrobacter TaxID=2634190 RepID=UPI0036D7FF17
MITEKHPETWRDLQNEVAKILADCGMQTDVEKTVTLVRDVADIDVVALETANGRTNTIFCECKRWKSSIPKNVVHGFRTIVQDGGANVGYIITSKGFQRGAYGAADLTNLRLVTWREFQDEFEDLWIEQHLRPEVTRRLDELMELVEPLLPRAFKQLSEPAKAKYLELREKYWELGATAMLFTTYFKMIHPEVPDLPLRDRVSSSSTGMPDALLDATGYRDFLDILLPLGEQAAEELKAVLHSEPTASSIQA